MSLYSGNNAASVDLVSRLSPSIDEIGDIADMYIAPRIGELKFVSSCKAYEQLGLEVHGNNVRITGDFDGWTYPDGKNYYKENFPKANDVYKVNDSADFFQLPTLKDFIKSSTENITLQSLQIPEQQKNDVLYHNHGLTKTGTLDSNFTIPNGFVFYASTYCSGQETYNYYVGKDDDGNDIYATIPKVHNGQASSTRVPIPLDVNISFQDLKTLFSNGMSDNPQEIGTTTTITDQGTFQPEHFNMPVMIYIGKPVNKDYPDAKTFNVDFWYKNARYEMVKYSTRVTEYNTAFPPSIPLVNGYNFDKWSSNDYQSVRKDLTGSNAISAVYSIQKYNVNFYYGPENSQTKELVLDFQANALSLAPTADECKVIGHTFLGWNIAIVDLENVQRDMEVYAQYSINTYMITDSSANGKIDGCGAYEYNKDATLYAVPDPGYKFIEWYDTKSTDPSRTVKVTRNTELKAVFQKLNIQDVVFYKSAIAHDYIPNVAITGIDIYAGHEEYELKHTIQEFFDDYPDKPADMKTFTYAYIDWGDDNANKISKGESGKKHSHKYSSSGKYDIQIKYVLIVKDKESTYSNGLGFEMLLDDGRTCTRTSISDKGADMTSPLSKRNTTFDIICCKVTYTDGSVVINKGIYPMLSDDKFYFYKDKKSVDGVQYVKNPNETEEFNVSFIKAGKYNLYTDSSLVIKEEQDISILNSYSSIDRQKVYSFKELWFNLAGTSRNHFDDFNKVYSVTIGWNK